jgi:phospholipid transport system substrate-binding protein
MLRFFLATVAFLVWAGAANAATPADNATALSVVDTFDQALISTMKDAKSLGFKGRYDKLAPVVDKAFDLEFMTKLLVGTAWNDMPADKQASLTASFRNFTISNYARRFDGYNGETIETTGAPTELRDTLRVPTRIVPKEGQPVELDYILHNDPEGWQVIDIFLQGTISQLATQRAEFQSVLQAQGVDALIETLDKKAADLATGEPGVQAKQ